MPSIDLDTVTLSYDIAGTGRPVLLIHGFASHGAMNWRGPGWIRALGEAGCQTIVPDLRGHGGSTKFYDPSDYGLEIMARDMAGLIHGLSLSGVDIMGYSLGARIALHLAVQCPELCRSVVLAGVGQNLLRAIDPEPVAQALEAEDDGAVQDPGGAGFRAFAQKTKSDLRALAACWRGTRLKIEPEQIAKLSVPALVVVGTDDSVTGPAEPLVDLIPGAELATIPGRDHMTTVGDPRYKKAVMAFWGL